MKRIIISKRLFRILILSTVAIFFTGCNRGQDPDYFDIPVDNKSEVEIPIETFPIYDEGEIVTDDRIQKETVVLESQVEREIFDKKTEEERDARFDGVSGKPAFWFPENHPADRDSLRQFQVLGLVNGTFYYFYITRPANSDIEIHAVARYHYRDGVGKVLHERKVKAGERVKKKVELEAEEGRGEKEYDTAYTEFHAQMYKKGEGYRICIYDDGNLILIDNQGKKLFSFTDDGNGENMRDVIHTVFDVGGEYYGAEVTDVIVERDNIFYFPVTQIKEDYTKMEDFTGDITAVPYLFCFSFLTVNNKTQMIFRDNENRENQERYFQKLAYAGGLRDPKEDWKTVLEKYPDKWGPYYLGRLSGGEVIKEGTIYQWKNPAYKVYSRDKSGAPSTKPTKESVKPLGPVRLGEPLENAVVLRTSPVSLSEIYGAPEKEFVVKKTLNRSYQYKETVTKYDADGKEYTETIFKSASDSVDANWQNKVTLSEGSFLNDYAVKSNHIGNGMVKGPVERDGSFRYGYILNNMCILPDAQGKEIDSKIIFPNTEEGSSYEIGLLNTVNGHPYAMAADINHNRIYLSVWNRSVSDQDNQDPVVALNSSDLAAKYRKGEQDDALFDKMEEIGEEDDTFFDFSGSQVQDNPSVYTRDQIVVMGRPGEESFLLTSFHNGMQLYQPSSRVSVGGTSTPGTVWQISDWPIYQAWPVSGSQVVGIGFDRTDTVYESMDIAMARVYTFDVNEIKKKAPFHRVPLQTGTGNE